MSAENRNEVLDLTGLKCPLPALFARRALAAKPEGFLLSVVADDPLAFIDIPHMCREEGHEVVESNREGEETRMLIRRGTSSGAAPERV